MKITLIQGAFLPVPPVRGGAVEKSWHRLGLEFARAGHEVCHVSRLIDDLPAKETSHGVRHVRVPGYDQPANGLRLKWLDLLYTRRALAAAADADVTVTNTFWSPLLARRRHGRVCVSVERMPKGQTRLYRRAAWLRANSNAVREALLREDPTAGPRILLVPNPITDPPLSSLPWTQRGRVVLYAGRLHEEKGIELLLRTWAKLRAATATSDWTLRLIGPVDSAGGGGGQTWLDSLLAKHGNAGVEVLPPVYAIDALFTHYAEARLFVYPSLAERGESFGSAVLEAMSHGTPPVVSNLACFQDFVQPGQNGFVFDHRAVDPAAALVDALQQAMAADLTSISAAATAVNKTHAPAAIAAQLLAAFANGTRPD